MPCLLCYEMTEFDIAEFEAFMAFTYRDFFCLLFFFSTQTEISNSWWPLDSNWAGVFVKLKLKPPFKNPGSATASSRFMANIHLHFCSLFFGKVWNDSSGFLFHLLLQSGTQQWSWAGIAQHLICPADQSPRQYFAVAPFRTHAANMKFINCKISLKLRNRNGRNRSALPELW